jgi:hypothetical protein
LKINKFCLYCTEDCTSKLDAIFSILTIFAMPFIAIILLGFKLIETQKTKQAFGE